MNKRLVPITELFLKENKYITADYIASCLNVSNKTIRNDVVELESIINDYDLILDKKTGSGMRILGDEKLKLGLLSNLKSKCNFIIAYSPEDRKTFILKKLLTSDSNTNISKLSAMLHVSRASIHNDLDISEQWLRNYNISLIKNTSNGLRIVAKEKNIRKALGDLIYADREYVDTEKLLSLKPDYLSALPSIKAFDDILSINFDELREIIFSVKELNFESYSDESILFLLIHLAISLDRIKKNNLIGITSKSQNLLMENSNYRYVKVISEKLSEKYSIPIEENEVAYFHLLILGLKFCNNDNVDIKVNQESFYYSTCTLIVVDIIKSWEKILDAPFSKDEKLLTSLVLHLTPVLHRLRYSLPITNPILPEIKTTYPRSYRVASCAAKIIKEYTGFKAPEEEIGYLALHLVSAIDRQEKPLNTVLVCHSSISVSELLCSKIKTECPHIEIVSCLSLNSISEYDFSSTDLVITTVPAHLDINCKVISVNTLLKKEDVTRLNNLVKKLYSKKNTLVSTTEI